MICELPYNYAMHTHMCGARILHFLPRSAERALKNREIRAQVSLED